MKKDTVQFQEVNQMFTKLIFCHYNFLPLKSVAKSPLLWKKNPEFIFNNLLHSANYKCEHRRKMTVVVYKI